MTSTTKSYDFPNDLYDIFIVRTGELMLRGIIKGNIFSIFDKRIEKMYSNLEKFEKKDNSTS